jgi:hypothetical protein
MKRWILLILISCTNLTPSCELLRGRSFVKTRSQSLNVAREMVGWQQFLNRPQSCLYTAGTISPEYSHSFRASQIAGSLFGTDKLCISGSGVAPRAENEILADYFGLSPDFISTVHLNPKLRNVLIDFSFYGGYCDWYFRINAPIVWARSIIELTEIVQSVESDPFPARYMDSTQIVAPARSFTQAISSSVVYGQVVEPLFFGRMGCTQDENKLSDIRMALGYTIINNDCGYFGLNIIVAAPTGTRPSACYLFEPIVGNGHHWELGAGIIGHSIIWEDEQTSFNFFVDIQTTHMFTDTQRRSFDLKAIECDCMPDTRFGSRYILVKEFDDQGMYSGRTIPGINRLTLCAEVSVNVQFDITAMFAWFHKQYVLDVGYEGWLRSRERLCIKEQLCPTRFGFKGIQNVTTLLDQNSVATQSNATLYGNVFSDQALVVDMPSPIFITQDDLDPLSGRAPRVFTHKFFAHFSYNFKETCDCSVPFLGIGGEVEFEGDHSKQDVQPNKNAVSQWGVWVKGGLSY